MVRPDGERLASMPAQAHWISLIGHTPSQPIDQIRIRRTQFLGDVAVFADLQTVAIHHLQAALLVVADAESLARSRAG
jgi:hypothetical protein